MEKRSVKAVEQPHVMPVSPSGSVHIAGRTILISPSTVSGTVGTSSSDLIKGLEKLQNEEYFSPSPPAPEDE